MSKKSADLQQNQQARLRNLALMFVIVVSVIAGVFVYFSNQKPADDSVKTDVQISDADQTNMKSSAEDALGRLGTFGVKGDKVTGDNASEVRYVITQSPGDANDFFLSRKKAYESVVPLLSKDSAVTIGVKDVESWTNSWEIDNLASFEISNVTVNVPKTGKYLDDLNGDSDSRAIIVSAEVTFTTTETIRRATVDDSSWDGTYDVMEKVYPNNKANVVFIQEDNSWKIYDLNGIDKKFLLANYRTPSSDDYADLNFDFKKIGTIKDSTVKPAK